MLRIGAVLRYRQEITTRKMSAEELRDGVGASQRENDDRATRAMSALQKEELLAAEVRERPARYRRETPPTLRMMKLAKVQLPQTTRARVIAAIASSIVIAIVIIFVLR